MLADERSRSTAATDDLIDHNTTAANATAVPPKADHQQDYAQQEERRIEESGSEALHQASLSLLPLNLLQIESQFFNDSFAENSLTAGLTSQNASAAPAEGLEVEPDEQDEVDDANKEPPDEPEDDSAAAAESEDLAVADGNATEDIAEEAVDEGNDAGDESADTEQESANVVADAADDTEEDNMPLEETGDVDGKTAETEKELEETTTSQDDSTSETTSDELVKQKEEEYTKEISEEIEVSDETTGAATTLTSDDVVPASTEQQQPTSGPHVDKIDDADEEISKRVAVDYASKSAGALVLEKSPNFKGTSNLLNGNRDKYAISPCEEKKFVVLSLSEDILVKQVKLVNYELYSSRVKDFQIQISATMGNWVDLGSYKASPASGVQSFDLTEPAWGRYLKFKFNSHYGDEYFCTLSQIMVHGSTMVQGFHEHLQETSEEEENQQASDELSDNVAESGDAVQEEAAGASSTSGDVAPAEEQAKQEVADEASSTKSSEKGSDGMEEEVAGPGKTADVADYTIEDTIEGANRVSNDDITDVKGLSDLEDRNASQTEAEVGEENPDEMTSRKTRNEGTVIPAASISMSSNVFSTMIGRLEPLQLESLHRLSTMRGPDSNQFQSILTKATDSTTKAIKRALSDPAILDNLQLWNEANIEVPFPPEAFGSTAIGPREQSLTEKLAEYIENDEDSGDLTVSDNDKKTVEAPREVSPDVAKVEGKEDNNRKPRQVQSAPETEEVKRELPDEEHQGAKTAGEDTYNSLHDTDLALANLLDKLPSIECLKKLDFVAFKEKALAARKGGPGSGGQAASGNPAEPIFKMLTDQIKILQSNLSVQDQFTREAVQCYQRVLLDVVVELQTMRMDHEARLDQLEQDLDETKTVRWIFVLYQFVMGFPNWASLLAATFFTSFVSPDAVTKPLELVQGLLDKHLSEGDHVVLSWTITACLVVLSCATTLSICYRLVLAIRHLKGAPEAGNSSSTNKNPTEENSCRFTIENADGDIISVVTKPAVDSGEVLDGELGCFHDSLGHCDLSSDGEAGESKDDRHDKFEDARGPEVKVSARTAVANMSAGATANGGSDVFVALVEDKSEYFPAASATGNMGSDSVTSLVEDKSAYVPAAGAISAPKPFHNQVSVEEDSAPMTVRPSDESASENSHEGLTKRTSKATAGSELSLPAEASTGVDEYAGTGNDDQEGLDGSDAAEQMATVPNKGFSAVAIHEVGIGAPPLPFLAPKEKEQLAQEKEAASTDLAGASSNADKDKLEIGSSTTGETLTHLEDERRAESGTRTPEVETDTTISSNLTKGHVSPSSVAKVSEFAGSAGGAEGHFFQPEADLPRFQESHESSGEAQPVESLSRCQQDVPNTTREASLEDHSGEGQKRRASL